MDLIDNIFKIFAAILMFSSLILLFYFLIRAVYQEIKKIKNQKTKLILEEEVKELTAKNQALEQENEELKQTLARMDNSASVNRQFINIGTLKVQSETIQYIVSQSFEQLDGGNPRIKVIHYIASTKTDAVYGTFENILEQLSGDFMQINKNQIVNLREVHKLQGSNLFLNNIKEPFCISDLKKEELELRLANL
ncbi:MAG: LytTR family transcriptional regulator DNA-binding domain-containing protein [Bacteroidales bacterium]|nr:LytTR family transcriptional regulator DNA-binding domain-containing protein [Bacteroidales bacterium]